MSTTQLKEVTTQARADERDQFQEVFELSRHNLGAEFIALLAIESDGSLTPRILSGCATESSPITPKHPLAVHLPRWGDDLVVLRKQDLRDIRPHSGAIIEGGLMGTICIDEHPAFALLIGRATAEPLDDMRMRGLQGLLKHTQLLVENAYLRSELVRLRREAAALRNVSAELAQIQNLNLVLEFIVEKVCQLLDAEISYIALADPQERVVRVVSTHGACSNELMGLSHRYGEGVGGRVAQSWKPLLVNNWFEDITPRPSAAAKILVAEGIVSAMCVPMLTRSGLVGVLYAASRREAAFTEDQLETLQRLAMDAAAAIETARLFDEQRRAVADLNESISINERFISLVLQDGGLQAIANALAAVVGYPAMIEDRLGRIVAYAQPGSSEAEPAPGVIVSSRDILTRPGSYHDLQRIERSRRVIGVSARSDLPDGACPRLITPVVAGRDSLGYVTLMGLEAPAEPRQQAALLQAAVVTALEFKGREAARTDILQRTLAAQENERIRIARDLHDDTSQLIAALKVSLETAQLALSVRPEEAAEHIGEAAHIADGLLDGVHRATADLRPPVLDELGLIPAVEWYAETRVEPMGIAVFCNQQPPAIRFAPAVETALFRIAQEALTNVCRHSGASQVTVSFEQDSGVTVLTVDDNGRGFDPAAIEWNDPLSPAFGLRGMRERAEILGGTLLISSSPDSGTTIQVTIPSSAGSGSDSA